MNNPKHLTVEITTEISDAAQTEMTAVCIYEGDAARSNVDGELLRAVAALISDGDFKGKEETSLLVHVANENGARRRLLLLGMGHHEDSDDRALSRAAATAVHLAKNAHAAHVHFVVPVCDDEERATRAVAEGAIMGTYENNFYQQQDEEDASSVKHFSIVAFNIASNIVAKLRAAIEQSRIIAESVNWARTLADEPGLSLPPREFARRAAEMAKEYGLHVESLSADEIRARGMGALVGVGQGSDEEPALIVLRYEPEAASGDDELWAFIGKGITFDTGGISIKHGLDMYEMKSDMAGGAAALGALRAIAQLKLPRRVVAIVPAAENMPSGKAIKPGDVVRTLAGYTIEVVDTDAEGRLVLVDGIAYAKSLGATRIVDLATLTGSIIITLGDVRAGLFSNDDAWAEEVRAAAERAGEPAWRMPVSDDYKKKIESPIADFKNYGGRPDAVAAALLLSKFAGLTPWVHLDIAGTGWHDRAQSFAPKGASGAGVRTLVELARGGA